MKTYEETKKMLDEIFDKIDDKNFAHIYQGGKYKILSTSDGVSDLIIYKDDQYRLDMEQFVNSVNYYVNNGKHEIDVFSEFVNGQK